MGKKINLSHNLMGCRLDNWLRLKKSNPITAENKAQARLITAVSSVLAVPAFWNGWSFMCRSNGQKSKKIQYTLWVTGVLEQHFCKIC